MKEKEYKITLTEEDKNKLEQVLKLVDIIVDMVEVEDTKETEEKELKDGDVYYFIDCGGDVMDSIFYAEDSFCKNILSINNCFKTKEEAEFEIERLKVLAEMKKFAEPEDRKWNVYVRHWYLYYSFEYGCISYSDKLTSKCNDIYFESEEKAKKCVEVVGEDRIRKFYLQIKE